MKILVLATNGALDLDVRGRLEGQPSRSASRHGAADLEVATIQK